MSKTKKVETKARDGSVVITFHKDLYPKDVLFGTAFTFLERCYVHLDLDDKGHYVVTLRPKPDYRNIGLEALAGEFQNEMVNEALRFRLARQTAQVRNEIVKRAIGQSLPPPEEKPQAKGEPGLPLDLPPEIAKILAEEDENLDFLEDPLGIAIPWEEKYGKGDASKEKK